eukprot:scaffold382_cov380-Prasinococcus_capsulatus_cf.AAC.29
MNTLAKRGRICGIGAQIGVGKESDIFEVVDEEGNVLALKLHRLGRTSFRAVKSKRDYLKHRKSFNWLYLSRLAALKEYAFMKALGDHGFPVPQAIDQNRHCVLMTFVPGYTLYAVRELTNAHEVCLKCLQLVCRLAAHGLIHCDFNEFNLMVADKLLVANGEDEDDAEEAENDGEDGRTREFEGFDGDDVNGTLVTLIDFPQMVSTSHPNAEEMFDRDVNCLVHWFAKQYGVQLSPDEIPHLGDIVQGEVSLDHELRASGFTSEQDKALLAQIQQEAQDGESDGESEEDEDDDGEREEEDGEAECSGDGEIAEEEAYRGDSSAQGEAQQGHGGGEAPPDAVVLDRQRIAQRVTAQRKKQTSGGGKRNSNKVLNGRRQNKLQAGEY